MTTTTTSEIVYPETDGMPLPDGETQAPQYIRVVGTVRVHFRDVPGARVNGNTMLYYIRDNPRVFVSPDCYVVLDLPPEAEESIDRNNVYLLWEVGKAPDFVLEIGSESTARVDLGRKRELYAELGVVEYWRYDPTGGEFYGDPLVGERLVDGEYSPIDLNRESDGRVWARSDVLNLDLWWDDGDLRFWDPVSGLWLLNHEEEKERADTAEARADTAEARADTEMSARLAAEARAEEERDARLAAESRMAELEAEIRRLRGD